MVCVNLKGLHKTSSATSDGGTISWVSKFGSITFNQYGKEFPTGGMNEKGLVVELMWLDGTRYPEPDDRPTLGVLQWIQYQLDNCSSIDELIETDKKVRIASKGTTPLHYLVADASGKAATIEFLEGVMVVHKEEELPFPVLTNNRYDESIKMTAGSVGNNSGAQSFTDNSIERFAKACRMVQQFQEMNTAGSAIDFSFSILEKVSQGSHTKWSIVYDIKDRKVYFRSNTYPDIKNLSFSAFDFGCSAISKAWEINQAGKGDISSLFGDFNMALNRKIVERSFRESQSEFTLSEDRQKATWEYSGQINCRN